MQYVTRDRRLQAARTVPQGSVHPQSDVVRSFQSICEKVLVVYPLHIHSLLDIRHPPRVVRKQVAEPCRVI